MEVQFAPTEPQPQTPSLGATKTQPIGQSPDQTTTPLQSIPPQPPSVQPQGVQPVPQIVPIPPPPQPFYRPSKKSLLFFGLTILVLYIIGFGGAWAYSRFFKSKQIPTLDRERPNPVSFSALDRSVYSEAQAIEAIKKEYPDVKDIEREKNSYQPPKMGIRSLQIKNGWKMQFHRGTGECSKAYDGCQKEQDYYFIVDFNGTVRKVGEVELSSDPYSDHPKVVGTLLPNFFKE